MSKHEPSDARLLQIGEVAERVGLSLRTLRYWEEVGLVTPSARSEGKFRLYSDDDVQRLLLVKQMRPLGLALEEMSELADLLERSRASAEDGRAHLRDMVERLCGYAARTDAAIERLERELWHARQLRLRIGDQLGRREATLEYAAHDTAT